MFMILEFNHSQLDTDFLYILYFIFIKSNLRMINHYTRLSLTSSLDGSDGGQFKTPNLLNLT